MALAPVFMYGNIAFSPPITFKLGMFQTERKLRVPDMATVEGHFIPRLEGQRMET